jgi:hypothetical protein
MISKKGKDHFFALDGCKQIYCIFESGRRSRSLDDDEQDDEGRHDNEVESDAERGGDADNAVSKFEDFLIHKRLKPWSNGQHLCLSNWKS